MNENEPDLRIKEGTKVDGITELFERESPIVQMVSTLKSYTYILIIIGMIYILIEFLIPRHTLVGVFANILFVGLMLASIYIVTGEISYTYSKKIGGRRTKFFLKKDEGIVGTITYNLKVMKKEEWRLVNKILRVNHLDTIEAVRDLKEYFSKTRKKENYAINAFLKNLTGVYLLIIVLGVISLYTIISNNINLEESIMNMIYIIVIFAILAVIILVKCTINILKKFSVTNIYTFPQLEKWLLEILINKEKSNMIISKNSENKVNYQNKNIDYDKKL